MNRNEFAELSAGHAVHAELPVSFAAVPMGHGSTTPMSKCSQDLPPFLERKAFGRVPAKTVSVSDGSTATDHTCRSSKGESSFSHSVAWLLLR